MNIIHVSCITLRSVKAKFTVYAIHDKDVESHSQLNYKRPNSNTIQALKIILTAINWYVGVCLFNLLQDRFNLVSQNNNQNFSFAAYKFQLPTKPTPDLLLTLSFVWQTILRVIFVWERIFSEWLR